MSTPAQLISEEILRGRKMLLWIGAGTSSTAGVPTDSDAAEGLAHRLALIHYGSEEAVRAQLHEHFRLSGLAARIGKARVRDLLLQQGWRDLPLSPAHYAIAAIAVEGFNVEIVTTNLDPLLEIALEQVGVIPQVISSAGDVAQLSEDVIAVVKVHGCAFKDPDPEHLILLESELEHPPAWIINFLNGRLQERVFVYSGFSGNAEYVRLSITAVRDALEGVLNLAFGVDLDSAEVVYAEGNPLGTFYVHCEVTTQHYASGGADRLFQDVANLVFRKLLELPLGTAIAEAALHGVVDASPLREIIAEMSYKAIRAFAKRIYWLALPKRFRVRDVDLVRTFKWMLLLVSRAVLEIASFRPVLACPYNPGPASSSVAPIILFDGARKEALICRDQIRLLAKDRDFRQEFQLSALPRWFALIFNCSGLVDITELDIIPREVDSTTAGYDPVIYRDENSLLASIDALDQQFCT